MAKLNLKIDGMSCECCVEKVVKALQIDGVSDVSVKIGKASMTYDESKISEEKILEAVLDSGFTPKVKKGLF